MGGGVDGMPAIGGWGCYYSDPPHNFQLKFSIFKQDNRLISYLLIVGYVGSVLLWGLGA